MNETHEPTFLKSCYFSCIVLLFNAWLKADVAAEYSIVKDESKKFLWLLYFLLKHAWRIIFSFIVTILRLLFSINPLMLMEK